MQWFTTIHVSSSAEVFLAYLIPLINKNTLHNGLDVFGNVWCWSCFYQIFQGPTWTTFRTSYLTHFSGWEPVLMHLASLRSHHYILKETREQQKPFFWQSLSVIFMSPTEAIIIVPTCALILFWILKWSKLFNVGTTF
jgi:hypothetical protein